MCMNVCTCVTVCVCNDLTTSSDIRMTADSSDAVRGTVLSTGPGLCVCVWCVYVHTTCGRVQCSVYAYEYIDEEHRCECCELLHTQTYTHSLAHILSLSLSLLHIHTCTLTCAHTHTYTHTHAHTQCNLHMHTHTHTHKNTHTNTHTEPTAELYKCDLHHENEDDDEHKAPVVLESAE
jgi:hypothetical protein